VSFRIISSVLLIACTSEPDRAKHIYDSESKNEDSGTAPQDTSEPDSDTPDTAEPSDDPCIATVSPSGEATGTISCTDGVCEIPNGEFFMGAANPDSPDQCPLHAVDLRAFAIDQTEVTQAAWQACVDAERCEAFPPWCTSEVEEDRDEHPVTCVTHTEARQYCEWIGGRLPTEAEWEKAARGLEGTQWPWGADAPWCELANYRYSTVYCNFGVIPVGSNPDGASPFGLLDVAGNALEWVEDGYDPEAYRTEHSSNPTGPDCSEPDSCPTRVLRGGSYLSTRASIRTTARTYALATVEDVNIGFRCAYDR